jgi:ATP-binding cassette, subfamily F, member 3
VTGPSPPLQHMARLMPGAAPAAVRAQLGRFGFSGLKAVMRVGDMSGGERARLALALITREAPHLLILDEPTNHLDVDAREALVQALNDYRGAVVLVSHDRHMLELTTDRLVLVDGGTAREYSGSLDDYTDLILGRNQESGGGDRQAAKRSRKDERRAEAEARAQGQSLRKTAQAAEADIARLEKRKTEIERAMFDPSSASPEDGKRTMSELMKLLAETGSELADAERRWLEASEAMEKSKAA